jgi:hypothetical protein
MNKQTKPNHQTLLQWLLRVQHLARQDARSERGSAMLIASIVTILLFSMLAAFLAIGNLNRSAAIAYTKSTSTFYAAESGLNARSQLIRKKVGSYDIPSGISPMSVTECINAATTSTLQYIQPGDIINDFGCQNYNFDSKTGTASDRVTGNSSSFSVTQQTTPDTYIATTYVVNNPDNLTTYPRQSIIPAGDLFAGMNMLEYTHRIHSAARTQANSAPDRTVLQLDFQTRFVPMFQFAVFYNQDLEITPGPSMNINGRVHTNGNLHLTDGDGNTLCIAGQVSAQGNIYNRRKHAGNATEQVSNGSVYIYPNAGNCVPGLAQVATNQLENKIGYTGSDYASSLNLSDLTQTDPGNFDSSNRTNMNGRFGSNVVDRVNTIKVPSADFLAKTDITGALSTYYTKADLRIEMKSNPAANAIPYHVASIAQGMGDGSTCTASFNVANDKVDRSTSKCIQFAAGQLHSLRQPVLVRTGLATDDDRLCTAELTGVTAATLTAPLTVTQKDKLIRALQTAIVSQGSLIDYSDINTKTLSDPSFADVKTLFGNYLTSAGITTVTTADLDSSSLASIAAIDGDCFKSAPIQTSNSFYNNREGKGITMLQTNIESLTIWNRDGLYVNLAVDPPSGDPTLAAGKYQVQSGGDNSGQGNSARQQIFKFATISTELTTCDAKDTLCKGSFRHLGLASADTNEGGLVFHLTVDANNSPGTTTAYATGQSPYGFAITGGKQLPGALTIATDRAAYLQGDYNFNAGTDVTGTGTYNSSVDVGGAFGKTKNPATGNAWTMAELSNTAIKNGGYKFPASILADSVNVTSNQCLDGSQILNCGILSNQPGASSTTINSAFLGGSDIMPPDGGNNYSGGWHNYPRFHENWSGNSLNIKGSFISLGVPLQVSGAWQSTVYSPPTRNWDYDPDFNNVDRLPPLTPNIVYLRQRVFIRGYNNY